MYASRVESGCYQLFGIGLALSAETATRIRAHRGVRSSIHNYNFAGSAIKASLGIPKARRPIDDPGKPAPPH